MSDPTAKDLLDQMADAKASSRVLCDRWREEKGEPVTPEQKLKLIIDYCAPHYGDMWAAVILGIILECDFRDVKSRLEVQGRDEY